MSHSSTRFAPDALFLQADVGEVYTAADILATYERDTPRHDRCDYEDTLEDAVRKGCLVPLDFQVLVTVEDEPHATVPADLLFEQGRLDSEVVDAICTLSRDRKAVVEIGGGASAIFRYSVAPHSA